MRPALTLCVMFVALSALSRSAANAQANRRFVALQAAPAAPVPATTPAPVPATVNTAPATAAQPPTTTTTAPEPPVQQSPQAIRTRIWNFPLGLYSKSYYPLGIDGGGGYGLGAAAGLGGYGLGAGLGLGGYGLGLGGYAPGLGLGLGYGLGGGAFGLAGLGYGIGYGAGYGLGGPFI